NEVARYLRRGDIQSELILRAGEKRDLGGMVHHEGGLDESPLHMGADGPVEEGHGEQVVLGEDAGGHPEELGIEADRGDAPSLAVSPVSHLQERLQEV